jgi:hypothetical protein
LVVVVEPITELQAEVAAVVVEAPLLLELAAALVLVALVVVLLEVRLAQRGMRLEAEAAGAATLLGVPAATVVVAEVEARLPPLLVQAVVQLVVVAVEEGVRIAAGLLAAQVNGQVTEEQEVSGRETQV